MESCLASLFFIYPDFLHQWHLCLVRCIPRAFGWKIIHRDQGVSWESCPAVVQSKHLQKPLVKKNVCIFFLFLNYGCYHNSCHACVCISESAGIRGEGFSNVPQILGRVQQRSRLHGLLVQVTLLPSMFFVYTWYTDTVCDISESPC